MILLMSSCRKYRLVNGFAALILPHIMHMSSVTVTIEQSSALPMRNRTLRDRSAPAAFEDGVKEGTGDGGFSGILLTDESGSGIIVLWEKKLPRPGCTSSRWE